MEQKILTWFLSHLNDWGYYVLFAMAFLETSAFVGLLVPGETIVVLAGLLAAQGIFKLSHVIEIVALGAIAGDTVGYFIGNRFGETLFLKYGKPLFFRKRLDEAKTFFDEHGGKTVFFGRFVGWLRAFAPVVAGMSQMSYFKFLFFNVYGGVLWAIVFSLLGYFIGNSWDTIKQYVGRLGVVAFIIGASLIYLYFVLTRHRHLLRNKMRWLDKQLSLHVASVWIFIKRRFRTDVWHGLNLTLGLVLLLLAVFAFSGIIEDLVDRERLYLLDFQVQHFVEDMISPAVTKFLVIGAKISGPYLGVIVLAVMFFYLLWKKDWWQLFILFLVIGVGGIFFVMMKLGFYRAQPFPIVPATYVSSFPSDHAFIATLIYGFLVYITWDQMKGEVLKMLILTMCTFLILLIGFSRIYLNAQWLTDVLAGYTAGFAWLAFSIIFGTAIKQIVQGKR
ncbi:MAG TPA: bifunctional DedA family/phosphatase PAP2 family protein [Acidiferrobacterales bacterium]|nr:bifunctional DedA family/phosphatase PAP2 family protein [Acidiferrobacterales bacterium]